MAHLTSVKPDAKAGKGGLLYRADTGSKLSLPGEETTVFCTGSIGVLWM